MDLLEHSCTISRNAPVGTNGRIQMAALSSGVACLFLPMSSRAAIENGYTVSRAYDCFMNLSTDVKVGDLLTWNGNEYNVRNISRYDVTDAGHLQLAVEQEVTR